MRSIGSRWACASATLSLLACSPDQPTGIGYRPAPSMAVASGDMQEGAAGDALPLPLVVRVKNGYGNPLRSEPVEWRVAAGEGDLLGTSPGSPSITMTDDVGEARISFWPVLLGRNSVTARLVNQPSVSATLHADVTSIVIRRAWYGFWLGPAGERDVEVPIGTPIEWVVDDGLDGDPARVASVSVPTGGSAFDSEAAGGLEDGRFRFVPNVAGTWEYVIEGYLYGTSDRESRHLLTAR